MADLQPIQNPDNQEQFIREMIARRQAANPTQLIPTSQGNAAPTGAAAAPAPAPVPQAQPRPQGMMNRIGEGLSHLIGVPTPQPTAAAGGSTPIPSKPATPTDQQQYEDQLNPGKVVSAKLMAHTENIHNPFLRVGATLLSRIPGAFGDAVYRANPELAEQQQKLITAPEQYAQTKAETRLKSAQADEAEASAAQKKTGLGNWEPMQGEQYTQYAVNPDGSQGAPIQNLWRNKLTGEQQWRPVPAPAGQQAPPAGGSVPIPQGAPQAAPQATPTIGQAPAATAGGGGVPAGAGQALIPTPTTQFGTKQMTKPEDRNLDPLGVQRNIAELAAATERLKKLPSDYQNIVPPTIGAEDTGASAKTKLAEYDKAINQQAQQFAKDRAESNKEKDAREAADRKEAQAKQKQYGYAMAPDGSTQYTTQYKAENAKPDPLPFQPISNADVFKDRTSLGQLNDVQINTSKYRDAMNNVKVNLDDKAIDSMHRIIAGVSEKPGIVLETLTLGAVDKMVEQTELKNAWQNLTPEQRKLMIGFLRTRGAILAYNRALTGARSSDKAFSIEEANLPTPDVGSTVGNDQLDSFQENIDILANKFPHGLPGVPHTSEIRAKHEKQEETKPAPAPNPMRPQQPTVPAPGGATPSNPFGNWNPT